jgi:hypothetical protein
MYRGWCLENGGEPSGFVDYVETRYHKEFFVVQVRDFIDRRQDPAAIQKYLAEPETVIGGCQALTAHFTLEERGIIDGVLDDTRHFTAKFMLTTRGTDLTEWSDADYQSWVDWYHYERDHSKCDEAFSDVPVFYQLGFLKWLAGAETDPSDAGLYRQIVRMGTHGVPFSPPSTEAEIEALIIDWIKDQIDDLDIKVNADDVVKRLPDPEMVTLFQTAGLEVDITGEVYLYPRLLQKYAGVLAIPTVLDAETFEAVADAFATTAQVTALKAVINAGRDLVTQLGL